MSPLASEPTAKPSERVSFPAIVASPAIANVELATVALGVMVTWAT